jgi:hypothetical protein
VALPSSIVTSQEQGIADFSFPAVVRRLTDVARVAYEDERYRNRYAQLDRVVLNPDPWFISALSHVGSYREKSGDRTRAYLSDIHTLMEMIERGAHDWLLTQLYLRVKELENLRIDLFSNIPQLHQAARDYIQRKEALPKEIRTVPGPSAYNEAQLLEVETAESQRERELQAIHQVNNKWLQILFSHPQREFLISQLAQSANAGQVALENAFLEAQSGIEEFCQEIKNKPDHVWRYPPIVIGTLVDLGILGMFDRLFLRFILDVARVRSADEWQTLYVVAGIAIAALSLFSGPASLILLTFADLILTGHAGWRDFERQHENDLAQAAQAFSKDQPFTDYPSEYGPLVLQAAAALLSAFQLPALIREARALRAVEQSMSKVTARSLKTEAQAKVLPRASNTQETIEKGATLKGKPASPERSVESEIIKEEERSLERDALLAEKPRNKRLTQDKLPDAITNFIDTLLEKIATVEEIAELRKLDEEAWQRIVTYSKNQRHPNLYSIKGKINEELIIYTPEYNIAMERALTQATKEGFDLDTVTFVRDIKGIVVSNKNESVGELTDGIIVAYKGKEDGKYQARIFAVFEAKSPSNVRELSRRPREAIGQLGWDYERFRELPTFINGRKFEADDILISRHHTDWLAMTPPEKSLSDAMDEWIRKGLPQFKPFSAPVRSLVLDKIAAHIVALIRKS